MYKDLKTINSIDNTINYTINIDNPLLHYLSTKIRVKFKSV